MFERRLHYAAKQGGTIAVAVFAIAYGLAMLSPSSPPDWPVLFGVTVAGGLLYAAFVYANRNSTDAS